MAGANMKDIKNRIKSVESTMQITKAMELVASSKLRKARERVDNSRAYFNTLYAALVDISRSNTDLSSPYVIQRPIKKVCYVLIAGDRGLAGGYNSNVFKAVTAHMDNREVCVLPIGKKAVEYCERRGWEILSRDFMIAEDVTFDDCDSISQILCKGYLNGDFDEICVGYTNFISMLSQTPVVMSVLPMASSKKDETKVDVKAKNLIVYEPDAETVFDSIIPDYLAGIVYGSLSRSWVSELAARRTAMDAASKNAAEMIESLSLSYNRARQGAITQEITEIVAGAEQ